MRLKLDENLSRHLKADIAALGYDVDTAFDEGLLSRPDGEIVSAAKAERRVLLTLDRRLADLRRYPPGTHPGIVVFRPMRFGRQAVRVFVLAFLSSLKAESVAGCLTVVEPDQTRIRTPND